MDTMTIAVVGTGVAGLGAAYALSRVHDVELFERGGSAGGHVHTVDHDSQALDVGFIVHNVPNYPRLTRLFRELGVATQPSEMSFSVSCACGLEWSSRRPWRAGPALLQEIVRFLRTAHEAEADGRTLERLVRDEGYSPGFRRHYLVPMTAALWSQAPALALDFPAATLIRFFEHHGMLGLRRHRWRTVVGGSTAYVRAALARIGGRLHLDLPVRAVERSSGGVVLRTGDGAERRFDAVVIATHAPEALALLADPTPEERRLLGSFAVTENDVVLHTDPGFLPESHGSRASWNYQSGRCADGAASPTMTYYLNRLQRLDAGRDYCVTLNRTDEIAPERVIRRLRWAHPQVTRASAAAQPELPSLNGPGATAFCGAWQGNGFHEDGLASGLRAAEALGVRW